MTTFTSEKLARVFAFTGGHPAKAAKAASRYRNIPDWVKSQSRQAGVVGAIAMLIPFAHLLALLFDIWFIFHKMAYCCWGIGKIRGCKLARTADLEIILAHWAGVIEDEMLQTAILVSATSGLLAATKIYSKLPQHLAKLAGADTAAVILLKKILLTGFTGKLATKVGVKAAIFKISSKVLAKAVTGFIPLVGAAVAGGLNAYFVTSISKSADKYYRARSEIAKQLPPPDSH